MDRGGNRCPVPRHHRSAKDDARLDLRHGHLSRHHSRHGSGLRQHRVPGVLQGQHRLHLHLWSHLRLCLHEHAANLPGRGHVERDESQGDVSVPDHRRSSFLCKHLCCSGRSEEYQVLVLRLLCLLGLL